MKLSQLILAVAISFSFFSFAIDALANESQEQAAATPAQAIEVGKPCMRRMNNGGSQPDMGMETGKSCMCGMNKGGRQPGMGMMKKGKMMAMKKQHMDTMEQRLANIERLMQELVDLQKAKAAP